MKQAGEYRVLATREVVWASLNDPDILAQCIDGCQSMERIADDQFATKVKAKIGPVSAVFNAELTLTNIAPPQSYTINASVKGGAAGFGKGSADVALTDEGETTLLRYQVNASVGGKLAQIGSRLIDGAATKMAGDFFSTFGEKVRAPAATDRKNAATDRKNAAADKKNAASEVTSATYQPSGQWIIWTVVFSVFVLAMILAY